jgi:integrase
VGDVPLHKISVRDIELFLAQKREEASDWTARKYLFALAAAFETARCWGHINDNPFRSVEKPKVPELLPVFFSRSEFDILIRVIPNHDLRELVFCAVSTGLRLGELTALVWTDVDFARRVLTVQNSERFITKNRRMRVVPMNNGVARMLAERHRRLGDETKFVFDENGTPTTPRR